MTNEIRFTFFEESVHPFLLRLDKFTELPQAGAR